MEAPRPRVASPVPGQSTPRALPLLAALALALAPAGNGCGRRDSARTTDLDLFFTAQTHGRLTPCGCFSGQFGGVSRLPAALALQGLTNAIGLDAGDALEGTEDYHLLRHRHLASAFASLGYVALNVGRMEASLPVEALRQLAIRSAVPLISANVLDRTTGKPVLPPWRIVEHAGLRLAVIGVVDPRGLEDGPGEGLTIERMETCLARILPEAKRESDLIALLAHTDEHTLTVLASEFYEIAVILGGRVSQPAPSVLVENRSLIHYTGNEGKSLGTLELVITNRGGIGVRQSAMILLTDRIPEHPRILELAAAYRREVRGTRLGADDPERLGAGRVPGSRIRNGYAGSESCLDCHAAAARVWKESGHGRAFASLVARDSDADPACIGCHTVGFGNPDGYRREYGRTRLVDVGCESCHGPGSAHVSERRAGGKPSFRFRPLGAGDCRQCHHGEFSRPFDWERFWPQVRH